MPELSSDREQAAEVAAVLKVLGHPIRLQIIAVLAKFGEVHVTGLMGCLELPQAIVSQQLAQLRNKKLVKATRRNGYSWYTLSDPRMIHLVRCLERAGDEPART